MYFARFNAILHMSVSIWIHSLLTIFDIQASVFEIIIGYKQYIEYHWSYTFMTFFLHINFTTDIILTLIILLKCLPILMLLWKVAQQNANKQFTSKNKMPTLQIDYKYKMWTHSYIFFCLRKMSVSFTSCLVYLWCVGLWLSLIHIWRCRRYSLCRSRWSPYH